MKIGVTGTREGMTEYQRIEVEAILREKQGVEFHHGDCEGVDVQAAFMAKSLGYKIICHPPVNPDTRGWFGGDVIHEQFGYLERDRHIVDQSDFLIVVPLQDEWQPKGGTWYTHDYAKRKGKPYIIVWPEAKL